jgi:hypothetical protein
MESRELAQRTHKGVEVTLSWQPETDELLVSVCDQKHGAHFEIRPERYLALDAYYHPYAYVDFSDP